MSNSIERKHVDDEFEPMAIMPGKIVRIIAGHSEAACYLGINGKPINIKLSEDRRSVSILDDTGQQDYSFSILTGEAGIYSNYGDKLPANYVHKKDFVGPIGEILENAKAGEIVPISERFYASFQNHPHAASNENGYVSTSTVNEKHMVFSYHKGHYNFSLKPFKEAIKQLKAEDQRSLAEKMEYIFSNKSEFRNESTREYLNAGKGNTVDKQITR